MAGSEQLDINTFVLPRSSLIEASAGTGKTFTITYLVLRLLLGSGTKETALWRPLEIDELLIVTFTNAATSDLRQRIREKIREARLAFEQTAAAGEVPQNIEAQLETIIREMTARPDLDARACARILLHAERNIDEASICTIHSFCNRALNQIYAFEAGEAFATELVNDISAQVDEACHAVFRTLFYAAAKDRSSLLARLGIADPLALKNEVYPFMRLRLANAGDKHGMFGYSLKNLHFCRADKTLKWNLDHIDELLSRAEEKCDPGDLICEQFDSLSHASALLCHNGRPGEAYRSLPAAKLLKGVPDFLNYINAAHGRTEAISSDQLGTLIRGMGDRDHLIDKRQFNKLKGEDLELADGAEKCVFAFIAAFKRSLEAQDQLNQEVRIFVLLLVLERIDQICLDQRVMSNDVVLRRLDYALNVREGGDRLAAMIRRRYPLAMIDEFQDTDPVQFSIFRKLYLNREAFSDRAHNPEKQAYCYLIGDPKQSIYAFRGSDINSYLKARELIEHELDGGLYTLGCNYRSDPKVVGAVNAMFGTVFNPDNTNPFGSGKIKFTPVAADRGKMRFCFNPGAGKDDAKNFICCRASDGKNNGKELYAALTAEMIWQCLDHATLAPSGSPEARHCVEPSDIVVLVRSAAEAELVRRELDKLNIPSVFYSDKTSVLTQGGEAANLVYLMEAMCNPTGRSAVMRLISSPLTAFDSGDAGDRAFIGRFSEDQFEQEVRLLRRCARLWQEHGFLTAFSQWLNDPLHCDQGLTGILRLKGGERALTNYLHIGEIIQGCHGSIISIREQLRWFKELMADDAAGRLNREEVLKRLESEQRQVRIMTIHKSKGLEFPVVMLPFLWSTDAARNQGSWLTGVSYYDEQLGRRVYDVCGSPESYSLSRREELEEDSRLLYVALTRACAANFLFFTDIAQRNEKRALIRLLSPSGGWLGGSEAVAMFRGNELFACIDLIPDENGGSHTYTPPQSDQPELGCSMLPPDAVDRSFTITSFSGIAAGLHEKIDPEAKDDVGAEESLTREDDREDEIDRFNFPRGTGPGVFLHELLEGIPFHEVKNWSDEDFRALCLNKIESSRGSIVSRWSKSHPGKAVDVLAGWLRQMVSAPILKLDGRMLALWDLEEGCFVPEMEYLIPAQRLDTVALNQLCRESVGAVYAAAMTVKPAQLEERMELKADQVEGFIKGFLDLVLRFKYRGRFRYYVLDYKSNYLGGSFADYGVKETLDAVFSPRNRYDVQYLLYTLALHRQLKVRLKDYDYNRDLGGVIYLFLRGLKADTDRISDGVFFTRPDFSIVNRLDTLCAGGCDD